MCKSPVVVFAANGTENILKRAPVDEQNNEEPAVKKSKIEVTTAPTFEVSESFRQGMLYVIEVFAYKWLLTPNESLKNKRLIKPLLVVRVGPRTNPKYGSHWTESLMRHEEKRKKKKKSNPNVDSWYHE